MELDCILVCGLVTAVVVTKQSEVDMSDLAFLPFCAWPGFVVAGVIEYVVRRLAGRQKS